MPSHNNSNEPSRLCVAKVATTHGVKGLVKLHVFVEDINLLKNTIYKSETGNDKLGVTLKNATAKHWLAEIENITDRTQAEALRGTNLYIDKEHLPEIDDGEFYISDLIGLTAANKENKEIGKIIAVENFGAGDLLEIKPSASESFYLPFTDDTVPEILEDKIIIEIPEGLLD